MGEVEDYRDFHIHHNADHCSEIKWLFSINYYIIKHFLHTPTKPVGCGGMSANCVNMHILCIGHLRFLLYH